MTHFNLLLVDDDRGTEDLVRAAFRVEPFDVHVVCTVKQARQAVKTIDPDVVLVDTFVGRDCVPDLLRDRARQGRRAVILITDEPDSNSAIEATARGACDYLAKPLDRQDLRRLVCNAVRNRRTMPRKTTKRADSLSDRESSRSIIGRDPAILEVYKAVGRVAQHDISVLIRGESGTGKELVAREIHRHSKRCGQSYFAINCAALPENLLESELFGHEQGAFTGAVRRRIGKFEQYNGGTIFLDEIGDMSPSVQGKILRLLQQQTFERVGGIETIRTNVRIVAATHRNLEALIRSRDFREDLFYRLNGYSINLPPLRDRPGDIPLLAEHFIKRMGRDLGHRHVSNISDDALMLLTDYHWPGNVRELEAALRHGLLNALGDTIDSDALPADLCRAVAQRCTIAIQAGRFDADSSFSTGLDTFIERGLAHESANLYAASIELLERYLLPRVLQQTRGNKSEAARILGITRGKVADRIRSFEIQLERDVVVGQREPTSDRCPRIPLPLNQDDGVFTVNGEANRTCRMTS